MDSMKRICFVAGARPNFMKVAPVIKALEDLGLQDRLEVLLVHTGQHYDHRMSQVFFDELGIPEPSWHLNVGSGSHAEQTGRIMIEFEKVLTGTRIDLVVVVGDVNSTIACALTARKLGVPVAHIEAGLRSFDWEMPEEVNRRLTDAISDYLFTTEEAGSVNLLNEGVTRERIYFAGNVMIDTLYENIRRMDKNGFEPGAELASILRDHEEFGVLTLHRPSNVDHRETFAGIWAAVEEIAGRVPIVFPAHPRTLARLAEFSLPTGGSRVIFTEPLGYLDMVWAVRSARFVMTDSGGLQEETTALGVPCLTIRHNTERPSTIDIGTNRLVGTQRDAIVKAATEILDGRAKKGAVPPLWDGRTSERIAGHLVEIVGIR